VLELAGHGDGSLFPASPKNRGAIMKASVNHKTPQKPTFTPKPLSIEQRNAIDLLILGKTDQETADTVGVSRETVWSWYHEHPIFMSTLERRRAEVWGTTGERLRSLMAKAVDNLAEAVESGDVRVSIELLKVTGMYGGVVNVLSETDPEKVIKAQAEAQVQREGIPEDATDAMLINLTKNDAYLRRLAEITADLRAEFGEPE
jgi:hypothetical protein